jgi:hypothetical protein
MAGGGGKEQESLNFLASTNFNGINIPTVANFILPT